MLRINPLQTRLVLLGLVAITSAPSCSSTDVTKPFEVLGWPFSVRGLGVPLCLAHGNGHVDIVIARPDKSTFWLRTNVDRDAHVQFARSLPVREAVCTFSSDQTTLAVAGRDAKSGSLVTSAWRTDTGALSWTWESGHHDVVAVSIARTPEGLLALGGRSATTGDSSSYLALVRDGEGQRVDLPEAYRNGTVTAVAAAPTTTARSIVVVISGLTSTRGPAEEASAIVLYDVDIGGSAIPQEVASLAMDSVAPGFRAREACASAETVVVTGFRIGGGFKDPGTHMVAFNRNLERLGGWRLGPVVRSPCFAHDDRVVVLQGAESGGDGVAIRTWIASVADLELHGALHPVSSGHPFNEELVMDCSPDSCFVAGSNERMVYVSTSFTWGATIDTHLARGR